MSYFAVVTGTPNHMEVVHTADGWPQARDWTVETLTEMRAMCEKYDRANLMNLDEAIRKVKQATTPLGKPFGHQFPYLGVTFQLQVKRVK